LAGTFVAMAVTIFEPVAHAEPTKLECIRANEDGQDLRRAGHFGEAVSRFETCSVRACPASVRDDCAARLDETRRAFPRIELAITTSKGAAISDAQVALDGSAQAATVFNAEPGDHQLAVRAAGFTAVTRNVTLREGERLRETIVLAPIERERAVSIDPRKDEARPTGGGIGISQRTISLGLMGLGGVGAVVGGILGIVAKGEYDAAKETCGGAPSNCRSETAIRDGGDAHTLLTISTITGLAGIAMIGGGVALYLTAPSDRGVHASVSASGLHLGGTW
jgi:hypothetical protein